MVAGRVLIAASVLGVSLFVALAAHAYRAASFLESLPGDASSRPGPLDPTPAALNESARAHVQQGLAALRGEGPAGDAELEAYQAHLRAAESLLTRSVAIQPMQAESLARLATIRWELEPPYGRAEHEAFLELVDHAAALAPRSPRTRRRLGRLLLEMGYAEEAFGHLRRAVELDAGAADEVVADLRAAQASPEQIAEVLPPIPAVLIALSGPFVEEGRPGAYADLVDSALASAPPTLLARFGEARLRAGEPERLEARLRSLAFPAPAAEGERLRQLSRALLRLGKANEARDAAERARAADPASPGLAEHLGDLALAAGDATTAHETFREAVALRARQGHRAAARARIYAKIGHCEEELGRPDRAYDAYRLALELDPSEARARERIDAMERAAGIVREGPAP